MSSIKLNFLSGGVLCGTKIFGMLLPSAQDNRNSGAGTLGQAATATFTRCVICQTRMAMPLRTWRASAPVLSQFYWASVSFQALLGIKRFSRIGANFKEWPRATTALAIYNDVRFSLSIHVILRHTVTYSKPLYICGGVFPVHFCFKTYQFI